MTLAAIRPDDVNFPLLLHVLGAMLLVGALSLAAYLLLSGGRDAAAVAQRRLGFRTLWMGAVPSYVLMRVGAQWVYSRQGYTGEEDPTWIEIGYITGDTGAALLVLALVAGGIYVRRSGREAGTGPGLATAAGTLSSLLLVAYLVAIWAMTVKPN